MSWRLGLLKSFPVMLTPCVVTVLPVPLLFDGFCPRACCWRMRCSVASSTGHLPWLDLPVCRGYKIFFRCLKWQLNACCGNFSGWSFTRLAGSVCFSFVPGVDQLMLQLLLCLRVIFFDRAVVIACIRSGLWCWVQIAKPVRKRSFIWPPTAGGNYSFNWQLMNS
jgi:hypothetical protein